MMYLVILGNVISIHALLAESDSSQSSIKSTPEISIHALLAESDLYLGRQNPERAEFLSTLSLRRATYKQRPIFLCQAISIHALLAESDISARRAARESIDFYPRSPCGERLSKRLIELLKLRFLSTLSLRRATGSDSGISCSTAISIHALLAESDLMV